MKIMDSHLRIYTPSIDKYTSIYKISIHMKSYKNNILVRRI